MSPGSSIGVLPEIASAHEILGRFERADLPKAEGFAVQTLSRPLHAVGGDALGVFRIDDTRLGVYIADVCGHGLGAALIGAALRAVMDALATRGASGSGASEGLAAHPRDLVIAADSVLAKCLGHSGFITLQCGVLSEETGDLVLCNAGHTRPIWWHAEAQHAEAIELSSGLPIGYLTPDVLGEERLTLEAGDRLILYTDGLVAGDHTCDSEEQLSGLVAQYAGNDANTLIGALAKHAQLCVDSENHADDLSIVVLERLSPWNPLDSCIASSGSPTAGRRSNHHRWSSVR